MDEKIIEYAKGLEGISELEWEKLSYLVNRYFDNEINKKKKEISLADSQSILKFL